MSVGLDTYNPGQNNGRTLVAEHSDHRHKTVFKELTRPADLQAATDLIVGEYADQGYLPTTNLPMVKLQMLNSLRFYRMFGAWESGQLVAVLGLIIADWLPMEAVFSAEIRQMRSKGSRVGEIGRFASKNSKRATVLRLMLFVAQMASEDLDYMVLTINPKHYSFYTKVACFTPFSLIPRPLPSVSFAPALGLYAQPRQVLNCARALRCLGTA